MTARVGINGFGRIGRAAFKILLENPQAEIVAINDLSSPENLAYLLKYDTAYGTYKKDVGFGDKTLIVDGKKYQILAEKEPSKLPWKKLNVDVVLECTGRFEENGAAKAHLTAGAKKVVVSAPTKGKNDDIQIFMKGVNHDQYIGQNIISNASCTTNCISPVVSVIHREFGIIKSAMTTIHAVTATQSVVDSNPPGGGDDFRRGRAAGYNMIPTSTGAAKATTKAIPDLKGKFDGISIRVPIITGSISDITFLVKKKTTVEEVNAAFEKAKEEPFYKGVIETTRDQIVSSDVVGSSFSAIVDLEMTRVIDGDLVKVLAWYDNEWGYSTRLVEIALLMAL